ncbi:MAG: GNAT family N-acetyltransferase [Jatrophihabitantaceae bacterium]
MDIQIRRAVAAEYPAIAEVDGANFGFHYGEQELADARLELDLDRVVVAVDGARIVGVSAELPMRMTVPGGEVAAMGLTWVSVEITHRRRGVLRAMIEQQLREHAAEGLAATVLAASEGGIYGRYGFGVASHVRRTRVDRLRARLAAPVDGSAVRRLTTDEARDLLPGLYQRWRRDVPGALTRSDDRWRLALLDREYQRHGMSGLFHLVHPDGYVTYRIKSDWGDGDPKHLCWLVDYVPITPESHAALWQALLSMDLIGAIESHRIPLDDPLPLLLADYRRTETTHVGDGMWVRPLDPALLLSARDYAVEIETVLQVIDPVLGDGRYLLRGGPEGATCERTDRSADLTLGVGSLGAVSLGGVRLARHARAGQVAGDARAITRLDRALVADRLPFHGTQI